MATATVNEDEDLIILSDDISSNDTSILDFDFASQKSSAETNNETILDFSPSLEEATKEDLFSLDGDNLKEVSNVWDVKIEKSEESEIDFDFWEDIEDKEELPVLENNSQNEFTINDLSQTTQEDFSIQTEDSFDRDAILDEVIAKMQSRKSSISIIKWNKQSKVYELNEQIKALKLQVEEIETEIKNLEKEDSALDLDISSIKKMKSSVLEVSTDRPRKHNLNNIKK